MGKLNLLKGLYRGKVGLTVGQKWKDKNVLKVYVIPEDPRTEAQVKIRQTFAKMTSFLALVTDQMKYLSSMNPKGMTIRNALIKYNKQQIIDDSWDPQTLLLNKGGMPKPTVASAVLNTTDKKIKVTFSVTDSTVYTDKCKVVTAVVSKKQDMGTVASVEAFSNFAAGTKNTELEVPWSGTTDETYAYTWIFDKHGSSKVGSISVETDVT